ncbi:hypothetical protein [Spirillospora sp. NPDC029432]|uniref:hypothetical protein n=1 Tax=Spirillospora sp. NPDC029432 TaxID=3154599 RepID=UPI00345679C5
MEISALEQRLRDDPGDLAGWLSYGDRLTERGDARGELIRLEQRRDRLAPAGRRDVEREIAALVKEHGAGWDAGLPPGATVLERRYGFATKVAVEWSDRLPVVVEQALRGPFTTALRVVMPGDGEEDWDGEEGWDGEFSEGRWRENLDPDGQPKPSGAIEAGLLATLDISGLTELDLSYIRIGGLGAKALAVSALLRAETPGALDGTGRMEALDLRYARVGDGGLAALAESPSFGGVRRLRLQRNSLTAEGVRALHRFAGLTELDLRYNEIGAAGVEALLAAPFIGSLRRLLLYRDDVGDAGVKLLANAPQLPPVLRTYWKSV